MPVATAPRRRAIRDERGLGHSVGHAELLPYFKRLQEAGREVILSGGAFPRHGMTFVCSVNRPRSQGTVTLVSADRLDRPVIDPAYLSAPEDLTVAIAGVRWNQDIMKARAFDAVRAGATVPPALPDSDAEIDAHIRATASTIWHVCGTCKMGRDSMAVVDAELRVHGLTGLRVADASVMPQVVSGNTNAAVIRIA